MLHPSTKRLIDRLSEMTAQRKIEWASGEQANSLVYDTEGYRVLLEGDPANLVLCDALGKELERASNDLLMTANHVDGGTYAEILSEMRAEAERIARGTEDAIASVLQGMQPAGDLAEEETFIPEDAPVAADEGYSTPIADAMEDNADELSAASEDLQDEGLQEDDEPDFDDGADDVSHETEPTDEMPETEPGFPSRDMPAFKPEDAFLQDPSAPDQIIDQSDMENSPNYNQAFEATGFDNASDIGKAVANLANQVNDEAPLSPLPKPTFEGPVSDRNEGAMRAATINSFATSSLGIPTGIQTRNNEALINEPKQSDEPAPAAPEPAANVTPEKMPPPTLEPIEEFTESHSETAPEAPHAQNIDPAPMFRPGQSFSLSGMATARPQQAPATPPPPAPAAQLPEAPPPQAKEAAPDTQKPDPEPSEENPPAPPPKRFNPWV